METAPDRVPVIPYKNHRGEGWIIEHEVDANGRILRVFIRVVSGGPLQRYFADASGQPTRPDPG